METGPPPEAVLAEARRNWESAAARYREAAAGWARYGFPLERGRALLGLGRSLLELEDARAASKALREAREVFDRLRAKWLLADVDRTLDRASKMAL